MLTVLIAAFSSGCGGDSKQPSTPTAAQPDPAALAQKAAGRVASLKSFHFVIEHENGTTPIAFDLAMKRAEGDMVPPDRLRADIEAKATKLGGLTVKVQAISVGDRAEVTNPFDRTTWVPLPGKNPLASIFDPARGTAAALRNVRNPRITGQDEIGGVATWKIEGEIDAGELEAFVPLAETGRVVKAVAWVGKNDPLVYRIRLEGAFGPDDSGNIVRKVELSRFDEPVTIEPR